MKANFRTMLAPLAAQRRTERLPMWPAVSIVLLVMLGAVFPPSFLSAMNLYLLGLAVIIWITSGERLDRNLLHAIVPLGLIIVIGLGMGVGADRYLYWKDGWYVSNPAVILSVGYVLYRCKQDLARGLRAFVIGGTIVALYRMSVFAFHPDLLLLEASAIRQAVGTGNYAPALAFSVLCAYFGNWRDGIKLPTWLGGACLAICAIGIGMSFSRTMLMVAAIGVLAAFGLFARRRWSRVAVVIAVGLVSIAALRLSVDVESSAAQRSFLGKIARSVDELTVSEYTDLRSININWRGYETARALRTYRDGSPAQWLLGQGFGAQVDLGLFMPLGTGARGERVPVRFVPILHNGYAYLLVKGGIVAVALYLYFLFWLFRVGSRSAVDSATIAEVSASRVMQAAALTLGFSTYVVSGAFNKLDMFPYLLVAGFLLCALTRPREASS